MGVAQGSILGQTLFSVYINDIALAAGDSLIHLYADDTILYTSNQSLFVTCAKYNRCVDLTVKCLLTNSAKMY